MEKEPSLTPQNLETKIGERGMRTLDEIAEMLNSRAGGILTIRDMALLGQALEVMKQIAQEMRTKASKSPLNFLEIDFRNKSSKEWLKELMQKFGEKSESIAQEHKETDRLILIDPLAGADEPRELAQIIEYAKYGLSALTVLPETRQNLPESISDLVDDSFYWSFELDFNSLEERLNRQRNKQS